MKNKNDIFKNILINLDIMGMNVAVQWLSRVVANGRTKAS